MAESSSFTDRKYSNWSGVVGHVLPLSSFRASAGGKDHVNVIKLREKLEKIPGYLEKRSFPDSHWDQYKTIDEVPLSERGYIPQHLPLFWKYREIAGRFFTGSIAFKLLGQPEHQIQSMGIVPMYKCMRGNHVTRQSILEKIGRVSPEKFSEESLVTMEWGKQHEENIFLSLVISKHSICSHPTVQKDMKMGFEDLMMKSHFEDTNLVSLFSGVSVSPDGVFKVNGIHVAVEIKCKKPFRVLGDTMEIIRPSPFEAPPNYYLGQMVLESLAGVEEETGGFSPFHEAQSPSDLYKKHVLFVSGTPETCKVFWVTIPAELQFLMIQMIKTLQKGMDDYLSNVESEHKTCFQQYVDDEKQEIFDYYCHFLGKENVEMFWKLIGEASSGAEVLFSLTCGDNKMVPYFDIYSQKDIEK